LATKIYDLATKIFPLVASWLPNKKVNFEPCFGLDQFTSFLNLLRENALIRVLGKYGKTIRLQCLQAGCRPRIIASMKNLTIFKPQENTMEVLYISNSFLWMNLREIPAICE